MSVSAGREQALCRLLDTLCPMHVIVDRTGHVGHAGPGFAKLLAGAEVEGMRLLDLLELRRPRLSESMDSLLEVAGKRLHLALRGPPRTELKGVLSPLGDAGGPGWQGGAVLNLSFGISIVDAVRDFDLTSADFAATDLAVEMLFLVEAKSAAMEALRALNERLDGARRAAEEAARTDKLTGLFNRRALEPALKRLVEGGGDFALLHLDLDHFKQINDTHGHAAGDAVLEAVAERLCRITRDSDMVIRLGGDEFLLILPGPGSHDDMLRLARRLITALKEPVRFDGKPLHVSASIGISLSTDYDPLDGDRMMRDADSALYAAKAGGRGAVRLCRPDAGRPRLSPQPQAGAPRPL